MSGDITIVGLVMGTHVIEDIQCSVPQGVQVTIPAEVAHLSKDLWRALSQGQVFRLSSGPASVFRNPAAPPSEPIVPQPPPPLPQAPVSPPVQLQDIIRQQQNIIRQQQDENREMRQALANQTLVLTQILGAIQQGTPTTSASVPRPTTVRPAPEQDAPTFIPSEIRPKDVRTRIEAKSDEKQADAVSDAASRLRILRGQ